MCKNCVKNYSCNGNCSCKSNNPDYDWDWDDDEVADAMIDNGYEPPYEYGDW